MPRKATNVLERFEVDDNDCWIWTGKLSTAGYARAPGGRRGYHIQASRLMYEALVGPIPEDLELDHLCRVRSCVNPDHLEPVTHAENVRRGDGGRVWREKTHCPSGHPYDEQNTKWYQGRRYCRACHLINDIKRRGRKGPAAECKNGHPYTEENTRIDPQGWRRCKTCERRNSLAEHYRRKARKGVA